MVNCRLTLLFFANFFCSQRPILIQFASKITNLLSWDRYMADAGQRETLYLVKIVLFPSCVCLFLCPTKKLDLNFLFHIFSICSCFEFHSSRNVGIIKVTETPLPISQNTKQKVTDHLTTLDRQKYKLE